MKSTVIRTEINELPGTVVPKENETSLTEQKGGAGEKSDRTVGFMGTIQAGGMWGGKMAGEAVNIYRIKRGRISDPGDSGADSSGVSR